MPTRIHPSLPWFAVPIAALLVCAPAQTAPAFPVNATLTLCYPTGTWPCPGNEFVYGVVGNGDNTGTITHPYGDVDDVTWYWSPGPPGTIVIEYVSATDVLHGSPIGGGCAEGRWYGALGTWNWHACVD